MSDFIQNAPIFPTGSDLPMVACPFCKADPRKWATCDPKPWKDIKQFIRHHVIGRHRTFNAKLLGQGSRDAISDQVFIQLVQWSGTSKEWKTQQQREDRWFEVFDIIAKGLNVERPPGLDPTWTRQWLREALNEGEAVGTVQRAIADDGVRRVAQGLVDRINYQKKTLAWLNSMKTQYLKAISEHEQELQSLKSSLITTVHLSGVESEFLVQIEGDSLLSRDSATKDLGAGFLGNPITETYPHHNHYASFAPAMSFDFDTSNVDTPMGNDTGDLVQSSSMVPQQLLNQPQMMLMSQPMGELDRSSNSNSMQNTLTSFDTRYLSTNPTSMDGPADFQASSRARDMDYQQGNPPDGINDSIDADFLVSSPKVDLTFTGMLTDTDLDFAYNWNDGGMA